MMLGQARPELLHDKSVQQPSLRNQRQWMDSNANQIELSNVWADSSYPATELVQSDEVLLQWDRAGVFRGQIDPPGAILCGSRIVWQRRRCSITLCEVRSPYYKRGMKGAGDKK